MEPKGKKNCELIWQLEPNPTPDSVSLREPDQVTNDLQGTYARSADDFGNVLEFYLATRTPLDVLEEQWLLYFGEEDPVTLGVAADKLMRREGWDYIKGAKTLVRTIQSLNRHAEEEVASKLLETRGIYGTEPVLARVPGLGAHPDYVRSAVLRSIFMKSLNEGCNDTFTRGQFGFDTSGYDPRFNPFS